MTTQTVVTYQMAYTSGEVDLCAAHESNYDGGALGPVQHGQHDGYCDACQAEEDHAADVAHDAAQADKSVPR